MHACQAQSSKAHGTLSNRKGLYNGKHSSVRASLWLRGLDLTPLTAGLNAQPATEDIHAGIQVSSTDALRAVWLRNPTGTRLHPAV